MNDEININEIIAGVAQANIDRLASNATAKAKGLANAARASFKRTYKPYLSRLVDRHSKAKSFLLGSEPVPLYEFFVPLDLSSQRRHIRKAGILDLTSVSPHSVLTGTGGCGKTVLMRHLLVDCIRASDRIPAFVELRLLNGTNADLLDAIHDALTQYGLDVDLDYVRRALEAGHFCLLLDGFDELDFDVRKSVLRQLERLATKFPKNWVVLTSRPDSELSALADFVHFCVEPLSLSTAVELVQKVPVDEDLKDKFVNDLRDNLFKRHESFLSNPLLLSIMLLTYQDAAHIPTKLNLFYEQAFEALFQKHDARKGGYTRKRHTAMDMQDFAAAFAAFSLLTYDKRQFRFSRMSALDALNRAQALSQVPYDTEDFLDDSIQAVCLLVEDGLEISFAHRSFQEYFAARFISRCPEADKRALIERFAKSIESDSVLDLLWEIDRRSVESYYLLPAIDSLKAQVGVKRTIGIRAYVAYVRLVIQEINFHSDDDGMLVGIADMRSFNLVLFLRRHYREYFHSLSPAANKEWNAEAAKLYLAELEEGHDDVQVAALKNSSPLLRHLAVGGGFTGKDALEGALAVGDAIRSSHARADASLEQLLGQATR